MTRLSALFLSAAACAACGTVATTSPANLATAVDRVLAEAPSLEQAFADTAWFCPMHPDVTAAAPGVCSKCGMSLLAGLPFDTREYALDFSILPAAAQPGVPARLRFAIREPASGELVRDYEAVHEKQFHLFVISQDLATFDHVHPTLTDDGVWEADVELPKAGYYRVLSEFVPKGGSPQLIARSFATADYDGDLLSERMAFVADEGVRSKSADDIAADLTLEPQPLVAGQFGHLQLTLRDSRTGEPIEDLEPYLGAYGHSLIVSATTLDAVHAHPTEMPGNDLAKGRGGPDVTFEGYLPTPGLYRAWTQFQRGGRVSTLMFTFNVLSIEEAFIERERAAVAAARVAGTK